MCWSGNQAAQGHTRAATALRRQLMQTDFVFHKRPLQRVQGLWTTLRVQVPSAEQADIDSITQCLHVIVQEKTRRVSRRARDFKVLGSWLTHMSQGGSTLVQQRPAPGTIAPAQFMHKHGAQTTARAVSRTLAQGVAQTVEVDMCRAVRRVEELAPAQPQGTERVSPGEQSALAHPCKQLGKLKPTPPRTRATGERCRTRQRTDSVALHFSTQQCMRGGNRTCRRTCTTRSGGRRCRLGAQRRQHRR